MRTNEISYILFLIIVWKSSAYDPRTDRLKDILGIFQDGANKSSNKCFCECDHYFNRLEQELQDLKDQLRPRMLPVSVLSGGCDDPTLSEDCGTSSIKVDGVEYSMKHRGHNIVVLNSDGTVWTVKSYDTWDFWSGADGETMNLFLLSIPLGKIVLIAVQDSGDRHVEEAEQGLQSVGADISKLSTDFRSSWILIGYKGTKQDWEVQSSSPRYKGPTRINTFIPLASDFCKYAVKL